MGARIDRQKQVTSDVNRHGFSAIFIVIAPHYSSMVMQGDLRGYFNTLYPCDLKLTLCFMAGKPEFRNLAEIIEGETSAGGDWGGSTRGWSGWWGGGVYARDGGV